MGVGVVLKLQLEPESVKTRDASGGDMCLSSPGLLRG